MTLYDEIFGFLVGNGVTCKIEGTDGRRVIIAGEDTILPVRIFHTSMEEARKSPVSDYIREIVETTGKYPLTVTEDRWHSQGDMIRSRLLAHLQKFTQIYARNCEIRKIDKKTAAEFLNANHSYGDAACRYRYGLYLKRHTGHNAGNVEIAAGTLVAVAAFSNARKWIKGDRTIRSYEWTRYASLPGVRLSGGMGKLLNAFIAEVKPDDIMTYADLEWSEGKVYEALGFVLESTKTPVMFAIDTASWKRTALNGNGTASSGNLYFQNLGSNKYRLKLTDYQ